MVRAAPPLVLSSIIIVNVYTLLRRLVLRLFILRPLAPVPPTAGGQRLGALRDVRFGVGGENERHAPKRRDSQPSDLTSPPFQEELYS